MISFFANFYFLAKPIFISYTFSAHGTVSQVLDNRFLFSIKNVIYLNPIQKHSWDTNPQGFPPLFL